MKETTEFLKEMISISGLSGYEDPISELIEKAWEPLSDEIYRTKLNSLHALKKGVNNPNGLNILVATHMDAIGFMVTSIKNGFLKLRSIGGIDPRVLLGQEVKVHTESEIFDGVIALPAPHTLKPKAGKAFTLDDLIVDIGFPPKQVIDKVKVGNLVSFSNPPLEMAGGYLSGHSLDNRASIAALTQVLTMLQSRSHQWDVIAAATTQEEVGLKGGETSGFHERPTLAIILDVDFAKGPGSQGYDSHDLNKGPAISWGPTNHPLLFKEFEKLAKKLEIPIQKAIVPGVAGTDGDAIQLVAEGIPTILLGIPIRYMHTPNEMLQENDIDRLARIVSAFITELDETFMDKLVWEVEKEENNAN